MTIPRCTPSPARPIIVVIQDGMLGAQIKRSVVLGAELWWQPDWASGEILDAAMNPGFQGSRR